MAAKPKVSDDEIAELLRQGLSPTEISNRTGVAYGTSQKLRYTRIAERIGVDMFRHKPHPSAEDLTAKRVLDEYMRSSGRQRINVENGIVLVGSDAHYWPNIVSTAHRAFCRFARELKPAAVILNGDGFDGSSVSRYPMIGWQKRPTVKQELEAVEQRLGEIEEAAGTKSLYWPLGNHDARYETFLASRVPEYEGVAGFHLKDKFPLWKPCWLVEVNDDTVIKHRFKNGLHAPHNNTLWAGKNIITGHLHSMKVQPISDYNGTRYGVDCGTLADPGGPQFEDYLESNPVNWRSGFVVLTFWRGRLLWPEVVHVVGDGLVEWRGSVLEVPNA